MWKSRLRTRGQHWQGAPEALEVGRWRCHALDRGAWARRPGGGGSGDLGGFGPVPRSISRCRPESQTWINAKAASRGSIKVKRTEVFLAAMGQIGRRGNTSRDGGRPAHGQSEQALSSRSWGSGSVACARCARSVVSGQWSVVSDCWLSADVDSGNAAESPRGLEAAWVVAKTERRCGAACRREKDPKVAHGVGHFGRGSDPRWCNVSVILTC
jgi:hypothetical protein